jgi:hypothetical protein
MKIKLILSLKAVRIFLNSIHFLCSLKLFPTETGKNAEINKLVIKTENKILLTLIVNWQKIK